MIHSHYSPTRAAPSKETFSTSQCELFNFTLDTSVRDTFVKWVRCGWVPWILSLLCHIMSHYVILCHIVVFVLSKPPVVSTVSTQITTLISLD